MGPIGCPETSVINYQYSLFNNPEESSSQIQCSQLTTNDNGREIGITNGRSVLLNEVLN
jgi:hypothetical protein